MPVMVPSLFSQLPPMAVSWFEINTSIASQNTYSWVSGSSLAAK